jgi:hypothetical protein
MLEARYQARSEAAGAVIGGSCFGVAERPQVSSIACKKPESTEEIPSTPFFRFQWTKNSGCVGAAEDSWVMPFDALQSGQEKVRQPLSMIDETTLWDRSSQEIHSACLAYLHKDDDASP